MMGVDGLASVLFAWAAVTKYHRLSSLNNNLFSHGSGGPRSRCLWNWFLLRLLSLTCQWLPSCCVLAGFPSVCAQPWCLSLS